MLLNDYYPHDIPIAKQLIQIVRNSNSMLTYKEALKQKRESEEKAEKDQRLGIIEEEITQQSLKKSSREKAIKEYHAESDKYAFDAEKRRIQNC